MHCLFCRKKIGLLQQLTDREYCSSAHRAQMRSQSARALRNAREYEGYDDYDRNSTIFVKPIDGIASQSPQSQSSVTSTATFGLLLIFGVFAATFGVGDHDRILPAGKISTGGSIDGLRRSIRSYATIRLQDDFKSGLGSWMPSAGSTSTSIASAKTDWSFKNGFVRPAKLRIWKDSVNMTDYQIDFAGEIERKGMSWAYRAKDGNNYYANKILITKPGPLPTADLVRYAVVNGVEHARSSTRLNLTLRADTLYRVQMNIKGSDFTTTVNGQMVDSWSDQRLRAGGVGFFSDAGEVASLRYVQVTDKDSVVGRLLSYLGFIRPLTLGL